MTTQQLHVDIHDGNGPPLLLVHGFMSSRAQWLANLPGLLEFCTPVVVELWGHGRSPMPPDDMLTPGAYLDQFEHIRKRLGVTRWYILGQSFGAGLTLRYGLDQPGAVIGQAWCNSNSALEDRDTPGLIQRGQQLRRALARGVSVRNLPLHPAYGKRLPEDVRAALSLDADQLDLNHLERSVAVTRPDLSIRDRFSKTKVPTLLLNGRFERSFQPTAAFACAALPGMEMVELDGGHAVNAEAALPFNAALRAHFEAVHSA